MPSLFKLMLNASVIAAILLLAACSGTLPKHLSHNQFTLTNCPNTPNCVSSKAKTDGHYIQPITTNLSKKEAISLLINVIANHPNMSLVKQHEGYLYVQFTSNVLGFVDDLEFIITDELIHIRSASRIGYSDFGANRQHLEIIRKAFESPILKTN
jgi:uncharacterized protein (DUF1499 family)